MTLNGPRAGRSHGYDKYPTFGVAGFDDSAWRGNAEIAGEIEKAVDGEKRARAKVVIILETYPGVEKSDALSALGSLKPDLVLDADDITISGPAVSAMIDGLLTKDRVFGIMSHFSIDRFLDEAALRKARDEIDRLESGVVLVHGLGASAVCRGDIVILADLARWEIQTRFRSGELGNWKADNSGDDFLLKYKRGYFFEWRLADGIKKGLFDKIDYYLDTNRKGDPKMVSGAAFRGGLARLAERPFRLVPYFDPGVWGGQWMREVCGLDTGPENYAWSFDGVPEENSLYLKYGNVVVETPAVNLVFREPVKLLGDKVHARFGAEFPIRFDFLDTVGGGNLSLQVHPLTEYIQDVFGMHYTQDESYYILDAEKDTFVYLGLKDGITPEEMIADLKAANRGELPFDDEKYVNKIPAKKHDHFLIPAGTVHCSGRGSMVLEISATPYIFTFKLWDWGRLGLDGKPRPVHVDHGAKVIQWERATKWVRENLVNRIETVAEGEGWIEERTGLHERQFIETRRHWFSVKVRHETGGSVNVLNLVEGEEAIVESPTDAFAPFVVHYAETFIIPESVKEYTIRPHGPSEGRRIATIKAYVKC